MEVAPKNRRLGVANGRHVLTYAQVLDIRKLYNDGWSQVSISERYGIHPSQISRIVRNLVRVDA